MGGWLTDAAYKRTGKLKFSRRIVAAPALLVSGLFLIPAAVTIHAWTAVMCLTGSLFFLELVIGPAWAVPMDVGGEYSGTVTGVMNMAAAVGIRSYGLFGTDPAFYHSPQIVPIVSPAGGPNDGVARVTLPAVLEVSKPC